VGPRVGLDDVEKRKFLILPVLESDPLGRPASRYTDCAIPASLEAFEFSSSERNISSSRTRSLRSTLPFVECLDPSGSHALAPSAGKSL
jgi:hypothetical protein